MRKEKKQSGFTLIEAIVALAFMSIALIPIIYAVSSSMRSAQDIGHNLIAANLAQEGIEVIRAIRDTNWLNGVTFDANLSDGDYEVEWNSETPLSPFASRYLFLDMNGRYSYDPNSATQTLFQRRISIKKISSVELLVVSSIMWNEREQVKSVDIEEHLFDWR